MSITYELYVRYYDDEPWIHVASTGLGGTGLVERGDAMARVLPDATLVLVCKERYNDSDPWVYDQNWVVFYDQGGCQCCSYSVKDFKNSSIHAMVFGPMGVVNG